MIWNSAAEFWNMGGYAFYVWGSFGLCAAALIIEVLAVKHRRAENVRTLQRQVLANKMEKENK